MLELTNIIIKPYVTEKTHLLKMANIPQISFLVNVNANKIMIKQSFTAIFGIQAQKIRTLIRKPQKARISAKSRNNFHKKFKIAHISVLKEDFENLEKMMNTKSE